MDSLNPHWLSIELSTIDASTEKWNAALRSSYEASFRPLLNNLDQPMDASVASLPRFYESYTLD